jgi:FAD:protein FMN transferase
VIQRRSFRAMGTEVGLFLAAGSGPAAEAALDSAEREFERVEALLSRFRAESELSALNREGRLEAGDDLLAVVDLALDARARTGGRFDPTVHDALVAAGYDRTFEEIAPDGASERPAAQCGGGVGISGRTIELEPGTHLDLGGIGKGYTVDRAAAILSSAGPALVDAGGDIAARGRPDALGWRVGIETAKGTLTLALEDAAIATSGRDRRHWRRDGEERHHLIDPSTGRPAQGDLVRVTVVAPTAVEAEVLAKSLFLAGEHVATAEAETRRIPAVLVTTDGRTVIAGGLA